MIAIFFATDTKGIRILVAPCCMPPRPTPPSLCKSFSFPRENLCPLPISSIVEIVGSRANHR